MREPFIVLSIILLLAGTGGMLAFDDYNKPDVIVGED